ncbi:peptidoglycan editing factor PgeF [Cohnella massiliensis]|uniref:peptidoglycan editing factor PgeF n=1 Tax=Cohnella massiliensis TaxID=1816691 RepID=UPI0009B9BFF9|nr:peptidoglycan editing factor PgeF [Cohnella massiliensis]
MEPFGRNAADGAGPALLRLGASWAEPAKAAGLTAGFTTRGGGVGKPPWASLNAALHVGDDPADVVRNRELIANALDWDFPAWTCAEQVHGNRVHVVTGADRGKGRLSRETAIPDADALITDEPGVLLTMFFADCVPLYFYDPDAGAVGLAHAGWKGTALHVAEAAVEAMGKAYGTRADRLLAAVGPSIGPCCYEVDEPVLRHMLPLGADESCVRPTANGKAKLDLKQINRHLMIKAGILPSRIEMSSWCTSCRTDLFFSHCAENGSTGRMASWIGRRSG